MTNGPNAVLAEIVENPLPKRRQRNDVHRHPLYYGVRNHIIDFLVTREQEFRRGDEGQDLRSPGGAGGAAGCAAGRACSTRIIRSDGPDSRGRCRSAGDAVTARPDPGRPGMIVPRPYPREDQGDIT